MSPSDRTDELIERTVAASTELRLSLLPAGTDYVTMNPAERALDDDERDKAREWLERLSEQWREAEDVWFTELGDDFLPEEATLLLEALHDSLVIALLAEGEPEAPLLTIEEVLDRVDKLGREGRFPGLDSQ